MLCVCIASHPGAAVCVPCVAQEATSAELELMQHALVQQAGTAQPAHRTTGWESAHLYAHWPRRLAASLKRGKAVHALILQHGSVGALAA
jgi:hypothetical protein